MRKELTPAPIKLGELFGLIDRCGMRLVAEIMPQRILKCECDCCEYDESDEEDGHPNPEGEETCDRFFYAMEETLTNFVVEGDHCAGLWELTPERLELIAEEYDDPTNIGLCVADLFVDETDRYALYFSAVDEVFVYLVDKEHDISVAYDGYKEIETIEDALDIMKPAIRNLKLVELGL